MEFRLIQGVFQGINATGCAAADADGLSLLRDDNAIGAHMTHQMPRPNQFFLLSGGERLAGLLLPLLMVVWLLVIAL